MNVVAPPSAFFLLEPTGQNNGVDFLGLRQTNLDMMADLIPGTNNVTAYVRPFSLLSWIFWKFHELCVDGGIDEPASESVRLFRERIEILFTWGARLDDYPNIPGKQAEPPPDGKDGYVPLTFKDWKRVQDSTSLIAALWYGPASKVATGLGLLMPVSGRAEFFRTVGAGVRLAEGVDAQLRSDLERYGRLLVTLDSVSASEDDAKALWVLWRPDAVSVAEQEAFRKVLHDDKAVGDYHSFMGKRSSTLALVRRHLAQSSSPQTAKDIRVGMMLSQRPNGTFYDVPAGLRMVRDKWVLLQVRQLQRLALESLLSWCETQILSGVHDTADLIAGFAREWDDSDYSFSAVDHLSDALAAVEARFTTIDDFVACCRNGAVTSPLLLIEAIQEAFAANEGKYAAHCFYGLLLCAAFAGCVDPQSPGLSLGGPARISLYHLRKRFSRGAEGSIVRSQVIENQR